MKTIKNILYYAFWIPLILFIGVGIFMAISFTTLDFWAGFMLVVLSCWAPSRFFDKQAAKDADAENKSNGYITHYADEYKWSNK